MMKDGRRIMKDDDFKLGFKLDEGFLLQKDRETNGHL